MTAPHRIPLSPGVEEARTRRLAVLLRQIAERQLAALAAEKTGTDPDAKTA